MNFERASNPASMTFIIWRTLFIQSIQNNGASHYRLLILFNYTDQCIKGRLSYRHRKFIMAILKITSLSLSAITMASFLTQIALAQEPGYGSQLDNSLNGTGYKIIDYRTESQKDVEFREWNHPAWSTYVYHDNSFAILGTSQVPCPDVNECGSFPLNVVVYARYDA